MLSILLSCLSSSLPLPLPPSFPLLPPVPFPPQDLEDLDLSANVSFAESGVHTLADAIKKGSLPELRSLNLQSTMAGPDGIKELCDGLTHLRDPKLTRLNIQGRARSEAKS